MKIQLETENLIIFQSALYQTTTTLIKGKNYLLLIDPNWLPEEIEFIKKYVDKYKKDLPLYLLFTHSDFDHIIAAGAFNSDNIIASKVFVEDIDREKVLNDIKNFDAQYYVQRDYPILYPEATIVIKEDNQKLVMDNEIIRFYLSPGHTKDGIVTYIQSLGILIVGDYLSNVEFPFIENLEDYKTTLNKLATILATEEINYLIPGHGQYTCDKEEMSKRVVESKQYIEKLQNSEEQESSLSKKYLFYEGMKELHQQNKLLIK